MVDIFQLFDEIFQKERENCGPFRIGTKRIQFAISRHLSQMENNEDITDCALPEDRCAQLLLNSVGQACVTRRLLDFVQENNAELFSQWMGKIKLQKTLKVCSFSTGPGGDLIGILQSLGNPKDISLDFSSLNPCLDWQSTWDRICAVLASRYTALKGSFRGRFISKFTEIPFNEEVKQVIHEADLIVNVNFISNFVDDKDSIAVMLKHMLRTMKTEAMVLFADERDLSFLDVVARDLRLRPVYGPTPVSHFNCFPEGAPETFHKTATVYRAEFGIAPSTEMHVALAAWIKPTPLLSRLEEIRCPNDIRGMIESLVEERSRLLQEYFSISSHDLPPI